MRRWEDDIKMNLKEIGINTRNWVDSAQDRHYWRALVNVFSNALSLCSSLSLRNPASHPYSSTDNTIVSCILIFKFLD